MVAHKLVLGAPTGFCRPNRSDPFWPRALETAKARSTRRLIVLYLETFRDGGGASMNRAEQHTYRRRPSRALVYPD
jgi:hypothetical protein